MMESKKYKTELDPLSLKWLKSEFTEHSRASRINVESSTERLRECGLDCVEESHMVRDAVEGQKT